jgi:excisionase family DNA binding protein
MTDAELTLHQVADELGVHYMTAYRYVRLGVLPAAKIGTGWVVQRRDLEAFREGSVRRTPDRSSKGDRKWEQRLEARLLAGDLGGAAAVVEAALAAGADLETVYLDVVAAAMRGVGDRWATGEIDVSVEHRASGIAVKLLGRLSARTARRGRSRGTFVLGAAPGERHGLPVTIVADLVRASGFEVDDLGADVPIGSLAHAAAQANRVVALGISVTTSGSEDQVRRAVRSVRGELPDLPLILGGAGITDEGHALALGADHYAADARGVVDLLDRLAPSRRQG